MAQCCFVISVLLFVVTGATTIVVLLLFCYFRFKYSWSCTSYCSGNACGSASINMSWAIYWREKKYSTPGVWKIVLKICILTSFLAISRCQLRNKLLRAYFRLIAATLIHHYSSLSLNVPTPKYCILFLLGLTLWLLISPIKQRR